MKRNRDPAAAVTARLAELATTYELPGDAPARLQAILDDLREDATAPTTVVDPVQAVDAHVADSLTGLGVEAIRGAGRIADLGAGAGFPGLVLAAALPGARVDLVESVSRKCDFLARTLERAGIDNAAVVCDRAESWADGMGACDIVTARALAPLDVLVEYAAPLLRDGGSLVAWKGRRDAEEEAAGDRAAELTGLQTAGVVPVKPFRGADHRHLHLYLKVGPTPVRYPRRPGMARKRPLGGST